MSKMYGIKWQRRNGSGIEWYLPDAEQALAADALPRSLLSALSERAAEARRSVSFGIADLGNEKIVTHSVFSFDAELAVCF